jgi:hypothetical protein
VFTKISARVGSNATPPQLPPPTLLGNDGRLECGGLDSGVTGHSTSPASRNAVVMTSRDSQNPAFVTRSSRTPAFQGEGNRRGLAGVEINRERFDAGEIRDISNLDPR